VPGAAGVDRVWFLAARLPGGDTVGVTAIEPAPPQRPSAAGAAAHEVLAAGDVMVGIRLADEEGLRVGSPLTLGTAEGVVQLRVGGIWVDPTAGATARRPSSSSPMRVTSRAQAPA
jgi:hypothetical protein